MSSSRGHLRLPGIAQDLIGERALLPVAAGERLFKLYFFRVGSGLPYEHRVLTKQRAEGVVEMISYALYLTPQGRVERSGVLRVPEMSPQDLERVIQQILAQAQVATGAYEEIDLSRFATFEEQLAYLRARGLIEDEAPGERAGDLKDAEGSGG